MRERERMWGIAQRKEEGERERKAAKWKLKKRMP
jgi:hypothetical protein